MKRLTCILLLLALAASRTSAQEAPRLRLEDGSSITGSRVGPTACFPASALEAVGARIQDSGGRTRVFLANDTIELQATSPFVRLRGAASQLAQPIARVAGGVCIPEQFFVQWLPQRFPDRIAYRDGALARLDAAPIRSARPAGDSPPAQAAPATPSATRPPAASAGKPAARVVVIDPGHGGQDPGRIGPNGLREKDAVLLISKRLADVLRERGYEVYLTRTRDTLISLADRPRFANRWKGDRPGALFLSIHANATDAGKAQGFETFFLSDARTEDERRVAEMENSAVAYEDRTQIRGNDLEQLLNSLRNDFYVRASSDLADVVQSTIASFHPGPNRGVKRAGFRVLVGAVMPAVLIEVAFISDRDEARALGTSAFQQKLAYGIAEAVDGFFKGHEHLWAPGGSQ